MLGGQFEAASLADGVAICAAELGNIKASRIRNLHAGITFSIRIIYDEKYIYFHI